MTHAMEQHLQGLAMARNLAEQGRKQQPKSDIEYMRGQVMNNPGAVVLFLRRQGIETESTSRIKLEILLKQLEKKRMENWE